MAWLVTELTLFPGGTFEFARQLGIRFCERCPRGYMELLKARFQGHLELVEAHYHPKGEMKRHVRAFIYVAAVLGKESKVADALFKLAEVKEVHVIPGRHDIMAVVEVPRKLLEPDAQSIYWFIVERIKTIGDVTDTETLIPIVSASKWSD